MYGIFNQNMSELQTLSEYISITSYTYMYMYIHFIYHTVLVHIFCLDKNICIFCMGHEHCICKYQLNFSKIYHHVNTFKNKYIYQAALLHFSCKFAISAKIYPMQMLCYIKMIKKLNLAVKTSLHTF